MKGKGKGKSTLPTKAVKNVSSQPAAMGKGGGKSGGSRKGY